MSLEQALHRLIEGLAIELPHGIALVIDDHPPVDRFSLNAKQHVFLAAVLEVNPTKGSSGSIPSDVLHGPDSVPCDRHDPDFLGLQSNDKPWQDIDAYIDFAKLMGVVLDLQDAGRIGILEPCDDLLINRSTAPLHSFWTDIFSTCLFGSISARFVRNSFKVLIDPSSRVMFTEALVIRILR